MCRKSPILCLFGVALFAAFLTVSAADSDPAHADRHEETPKPWPHGIVPYDLSKLTLEQQGIAKRAMQRWMDTSAQIRFTPRTTEVEYIYFTGNLTNGNNTTYTGFHKGARTEINITAFWWRQEEWMVVHELGHVLGFHHEFQRWDRDQYVTIHYENIKQGREFDYDWIPRTNWIVATDSYDFRSIMHYRICWASKCEGECRDGVGNSPCAVISPVDTNYDGVIGQWGDNRISVGDAEKARLIYGTRAKPGL